MPHLAALLLALSLGPAAATDATDPTQGAAWRTPAEASDFQRTPRLEETLAWFRALAEASPMVDYAEFARSPQGRPLARVVVSADGVRDPDQAHADGRTVVLVQAAIHAGENEGKDALMAFVRDIAIHGRHHDHLQDVVLVLLPVFNVDGHERFSPHNRINQNGPEAMGWRVTANNLNLNRDFAKADAPEMRAWLGLWNRWRPHMLVDMHNTNGADYQYAMTWAFERAGNLHPAIEAWQERAFNGTVAPAMARRGWPLFTYVMMADPTDPGQGLFEWASSPRYSTGYAAVANRAGLLLETHMLKDFRTRTEVNVAILEELLATLAADGQALRDAVERADAGTVALAAGGGSLAVDFRTTDETREVEFLGYAAHAKTSTLSGGTWVRWDPEQPVTYTVPMRDRFEATAEVTLPAAWVVPGEWREVIDRLADHGIHGIPVGPVGGFEAEVTRLHDPAFSPTPVEGRQVLTRVSPQRARERIDIPAGSLLVPADQPLARLAAHLLEPEAPDALLRWGFFNAVFERKEYAEPRVMEAIARQMLESDPQLREAFEARRSDDAAFAADPRAILYWFYQRSPWYDEAFQRYPVLRLDPADLQRLRAAD